MKRVCTLFLLLPLVLPALAAPPAHHTSLATMNGRSRALFLETMRMNGKYWDPAVGLIHAPLYVPGAPVPDTHKTDSHSYGSHTALIRETSFYALSLLIRDAPGDRKAAASAIDAVLQQQFTQPGFRWYGTFRRGPEEPVPGDDARKWYDWDPNWREFIGTTLEMILIEYPDRIPPELADRMYKSIDLAVQGEIDEKRLIPSYTNPALMFGALLDFAANHDNRADWKQLSATWNEKVFALFDKHGAFAEYNSATYYGVDMLGITMWRDYGSTEHMRAMGTTMEAGLWHDVAALYHPGLRNICGPWDRSYGMDMETFPSLIALWMAADMNEAQLPLPPLDKIEGYTVAYMPQVAVLGSRIPPADLAKLKSFAGEHAFRRQIDDTRVATAWIGKRAIWGGEFTGKTDQVGKDSQFRPLTVQWRTPSGEIGWVAIASSPMLDVTASKEGLEISTTGDLRLRVHAKGLDPAKLTEKLWTVPGLSIAVAADTHGSFTLEKSDPKFNIYLETPADTYDLIYPGVTGAKLKIAAGND
ncbi:MAG: hypothetical protein P4K83_09580 [Terracidiphilus sp.]|nr:hypothetical protein [Terracidiphilus sp.]